MAIITRETKLVENIEKVKKSFISNWEECLSEFSGESFVYMMFCTTYPVIIDEPTESTVIKDRYNVMKTLDYANDISELSDKYKERLKGIEYTELHNTLLRS